MTTKVLTTITGETFKVSPNRRQKTFTIRKRNGLKFRTLQMDKEEFNSALNWSGNDWKQFLKTDEYYTI